jgi:hypothetical protein
VNPAPAKPNMKDIADPAYMTMHDVEDIIFK